MDRNTYFEQNQEILTKLQRGTVRQEVHGVTMEVKPIPDPIPESVLDPRVYRNRKAAEERGNPWAEYLEIPVELIRKSPGYPNHDITSVKILSESRTITGRDENSITLLIYRPAPDAAPGQRAFLPGRCGAERKQKKPAMLFFHGGAFIAGSTRVVENFCRLLAELADMTVIGVEYRLAPEHPFPAGQNDCYDAFEWVYAHADELDIDRNYIAVGGDSAGGTLAAGCSLLEREAVSGGKIPQSRICYEALLYPGVLVDNFKLDDYKWKMSDYDIPETDLLAQGAALSLKAMTAEMPRLYMGEEGHVKNPLAAPLCQESLSGLPRTLVILCEYDYLRLSGEAFCRKLVRGGVETRSILYRGMDHAFIDKTGDYPQAYDAAAEIAKDMGKVCGYAEAEFS